MLNKANFHYKRKTRKRRYYAVSQHMVWWPVRELKISAHFSWLVEICRKARKYGILEQYTKIRLRCFLLSFCTLSGQIADKKTFDIPLYLFVFHRCSDHISGQNHTKILHVPLMILQVYDIGTTKRIEDICTLGFLLFDLHDYLNGRSPPWSDRIFGLMEDLIYAVRWSFPSTPYHTIC